MIQLISKMRLCRTCYWLMLSKKGKLQKEKERLQSLLEMIALRSTQLSETMGNYTRRSVNEFYSNDLYRDPLQDFVNDMKSLINRNQYLEKSFGELQVDVTKISDISKFFEHVEEIEAIVGLKGH